MESLNLSEQEKRRSAARQQLRNELQAKMMSKAFPKSSEPIREWLSEEEGPALAQRFGDWFDKTGGVGVDPAREEDITALLRELQGPTVH
ncbi:MAG: hypothetical protein JWO84_317 [Parcubacteria group bacterium]|nr:hypothetical protein [Parcubacteria group bacterium]